MSTKFGWCLFGGLALSALFLSSFGGTAATAEDKPSTSTAVETPAQHDARMQWFRDARFGMFIHWGLYSQLGGEWQGKEIGGGAEWIQLQLNIPSSQYSPLAKKWTPYKYDPREWVRMAKAAGFKYICITTKHHDGFCLWPTKQNNDWNVADSTTFKTDLLKPLAEACKAEGMTFCIYHSVLDWHHPDWPIRPGFNDYAKGKPDKERYKKDYLYPQLKELFSNYGDIGMIWLDGTWDQGWSSEDGKELEDYIRSLQPSVVINNRSGYKPPQPKFDFEIKNAYSYIFAGDYISPEGEVPPTGLPGIDWETCQTMQLPNNWGYSRLVGYRPTRDLLRQLIDVASKGGNLLLNVGPTAEGEFTPQTVERLRIFADWMKVNATAIHGTTASPFPALPFNGRCTQKPGTLYLHVFDWPSDGKLLVPVKNRIKKAWLLADPQTALVAETGKQGVVLKLPAKAPDPIASVVAVEIEGKPEVIPVASLLSKGKPVEVSGEWKGREKELTKKHINDGEKNTTWAAPEKDRNGWIILDLQKEHEVEKALLSDAPYQRIREFELEAELNGEWKKIASGTKIGSELQLPFEPVKARRFRLNLLKADDTPTLAEFQLFGE